MKGQCIDCLQHYEAVVGFTTAREFDIDKLAPYGTDGRLLLTADFKATLHKTRTKIKIPASISFRYCALI